MKKTDKKTENAIRRALTEVCELALEKVAGFKWITHFVNYHHFPKSLMIVCVFDTKDDYLRACRTHEDDYLRSLIKEKLTAVNIHIKDMRKHVDFDTEEACKNENDGQWSERVKQ